jgi:hypothetical protein
MIYVFDNIINLEEQELIKNKFLGDNFSWYFIKDISKLHNNIQNRPAFSHTFIRDEKNNSTETSIVLNIIENSCKKINLKYKKILQARTFLQLPLNRNFIGKEIDTPHIDNSQSHIVILYYVIDSDGDTIVYNCKNKNKVSSFKDVKILKKIKPKQGRVVIFDGLYYHTAEQPKENKRCIINCNII